MIRLSELLGTPLEDEAGKEIGHLADLRFSGAAISAKDFRLRFILFGRKSYFERLGLWKRPVEKLPMDRVQIGAKAIRLVR